MKKKEKKKKKKKRNRGRLCVVVKGMGWHGERVLKIALVFAFSPCIYEFVLLCLSCSSCRDVFLCVCVFFLRLSFYCLNYHLKALFKL